MARKQNKNKPLAQKGISPVAGRAGTGNEYDLEKNIKKINSYSKNKRERNKDNIHITVSRKNDEHFSNENGIVESINANSVSVRTGDISAWDSFIKLDDKITNFNYKNDEDHTNLRRELEDKIKQSETTQNVSIKECKESVSKRLPIQWYLWTIAGLVAIVGIWYKFSYAEVHPLPAKVNEIEKRLDVIENKNIKTSQDSLNYRTHIN